MVRYGRDPTTRRFRRNLDRVEWRSRHQSKSARGASFALRLSDDRCPRNPTARCQKSKRTPRITLALIGPGPRPARCSRSPQQTLPRFLRAQEPSKRQAIDRGPPPGDLRLPKETPDQKWLRETFTAI